MKLGTALFNHVHSSPLNIQLYAHKVWDALLYSMWDTMYYWTTSIFWEAHMLPYGTSCIGDNFQSPDSNPQMHTFEPSKYMILRNKQQQSVNKHGNNYKKVPQDELFTIHPGLHPGLPESLLRLLANQPEYISSRISTQSFQYE